MMNVTKSKQILFSEPLGLIFWWERGITNISFSCALLLKFVLKITISLFTVVNLVHQDCISSSELKASSSWNWFVRCLVSKVLQGNIKTVWGTDYLSDSTGLSY